MTRLIRGRIFLGVCVAAAMFWAGCSSEDGEQTKTEVLRRTLDPRVQTFLALGRQAVQQGSYPYALAMADSAEQYEPDLADVYLLRGTVFTLMNRFDAAQKAYEQVIALDQDFPGARLSIGEIALKRGRFREALGYFKAEEEVAPAAPLYVGMGRAYSDLGVVDSARMAYERAIALDSTDARTYFLYGQLSENAGDLETALAYSRKALALRPADPNYQFIVGAQLFRSGRLEEAVPFLRQAAETSPLNYPAQYNLGQVLARLGRQEEADHYLARADSTQEVLHQLTLAEEAATRNPDSVENWMKLGDLFHAAGLYDRAFEVYNVAAAIEPSNLSVQHALARTAMARGRTEDAIRRFQGILRADEARVDVWLNLGLAHAVTGNCPEARRAWETALQHKPGDATAEGYLDGLCQFQAQ